jgi:hypothetical protein
MSEQPISRYFKDIWAKFRALKRWQQVLIGILLFSVIAGSAGSSESDTASVDTSVEATSATPVPTKAATAEPTPEVSASATPDSPIDFRLSALRDLGDMRKDLKDARAGVTADGLVRYYWNIGEVEFNMMQLETLVPREEYAEKWNTALHKLREKVDLLNTEEESLTISKAKAGLDKVLSSIAPLEAIARTIAN